MMHGCNISKLVIWLFVYFSGFNNICPLFCEFSTRGTIELAIIPQINPFDNKDVPVQKGILFHFFHFSSIGSWSY